MYKIQRKTTSKRDRASGVPVCSVGRTPRRDKRKEQYSPEDVDYLFIIDGNDDYYIVPLEEIGAITNLSLSTVEHRKVDDQPA